MEYLSAQRVLGAPGRNFHNPGPKGRRMLGNIPKIGFLREISSQGSEFLSSRRQQELCGCRNENFRGVSAGLEKLWGLQGFGDAAQDDVPAQDGVPAPSR